MNQMLTHLLNKINEILNLLIINLIINKLNEPYINTPIK